MSIFENIEYYISLFLSQSALSDEPNRFLIWRLNLNLPPHILRYLHILKTVLTVTLSYVLEITQYNAKSPELANQIAVFKHVTTFF